MATWAEILSDPKTYGDDVKVSINGADMTIGDLRNQAGLKSEFTKATQKHAEERKQWEGQLQQHQQNQQYLQQQLQQAMARRGVDPADATNDELSSYRQDPVFGPLVKMIEGQKEVIGQLANRIHMDEVSVRSMRYQDDLKQLKQQDADLNTDELVKFTTDLYSKGPDIHQAHKLYRRERDLDLAVKDAEKRGYEKAKAEAPLVPMPGGRRYSAPVATAAPKDMDEAESKVLQDPEILQQFA